MMKTEHANTTAPWGTSHANGNGQRRETPSVLELRKRLGMTQEQLARELGVTVGTVNRWENGRFRPSPLALRGLERLAERAAQVERLDNYAPMAFSNGR
jgi:DNA-binding transcriptional regulator YiaG